MIAMHDYSVFNPFLEQPYIWPHLIAAQNTPCIHVNDNGFKL